MRTSKDLSTFTGGMKSHNTILLDSILDRGLVLCLHQGFMASSLELHVVYVSLHDIAPATLDTKQHQYIQNKAGFEKYAVDAIMQGQERLQQEWRTLNRFFYDSNYQVWKISPHGTTIPEKSGTLFRNIYFAFKFSSTHFQPFIFTP